MKYLSFALLLAVSVVNTSLGHRVPHCVTIIKAVEAGFQVTHRLHEHEALLGAATLEPNRRLSVDSLETQALIALYVEQHFELFDAEENKLSLSLLGAEVDGDTIFVFQESAQALPTTLSIRNTMLLDEVPDQSNLVNIEDNNGIRSLSFSTTQRVQTIAL